MELFRLAGGLPGLPDAGEPLCGPALGLDLAGPWPFMAGRLSVGDALIYEAAPVDPGAVGSANCAMRQMEDCHAVSVALRSPSMQRKAHLWVLAQNPCGSPFWPTIARNRYLRRKQVSFLHIRAPATACEMPAKPQTTYFVNNKHFLPSIHHPFRRFLDRHDRRRGLRCEPQAIPPLRPCSSGGAASGFGGYDGVPVAPFTFRLHG